jgi:hypothetical protein
VRHALWARKGTTRDVYANPAIAADAVADRKVVSSSGLHTSLWEFEDVLA